LVAFICLLISINCQTFQIQNNQFVLNGNPFRLKSGEIHYARIHPGNKLDKYIFLL